MLLTADTVGGVWSHALELARALRGRGTDVLLAALGPAPSAGQEREARAIAGLELRTAPWKLPWMDDPWDDVARAGDWLLNLAASWDADLAHLSEPVLAAAPWEIPTLAVGHSCVRSWFEAVRGTSASPEWDRYGEAMTAGFRAAGAVVAPSRAMLDALRRHYGVRHGSVVPNGRDPARYLPGPKEPIVLTAGRLWDPAKNLALLAQAAPSLPWPVYAAGDTTAPEGGAGLDAGRVRLLGTLDPDAMAAWMGRAAVFALPARYEPFGLTVLEAALSGCALVLGDIASLRELWDGVAIFVPPDEPDTLRAALAALADDPGLRQTLAMRARRRALAFSPERMTAGYLGVYARLLEEAPTCAS
ncbi:MAG TPA: glycosyltransferase [Gemmatimonadales bacterium]